MQLLIVTFVLSVLLIFTFRKANDTEDELDELEKKHKHLANEFASLKAEYFTLYNDSRTFELDVRRTLVAHSGMMTKNREMLNESVKMLDESIKLRGKLDESKTNLKSVQEGF